MPIPLAPKFILEGSKANNNLRVLLKSLHFFMSYDKGRVESLTGIRAGGIMTR